MTALRYLIDTVAGSAASVRRRRRIDPTELVGRGQVKINLGSGLQVAPGWINVDASLNALIADWPSFLQARLFALSGQKPWFDRTEYLRRLRSNRFVHADLTRPLPFSPESADFMFCSHVLEHLTRLQGVGLLTEAHRILRPGGTMRVGVPNLELAIDLYRAGKARDMLDRFFYRPESGRLAQHRYMYDVGLLTEVLEEAGFSKVVRREYRSGVVPDLDKLDNRPEQTLFVEATKG